MSEPGDSPGRKRAYPWKRKTRPPVPDPTGQRRRIARFLARRGPIWGDAAAEALGMTDEKWWELVNGCRWFRLDGKGWVLTEGGRAEALGGRKG